MEYESAPNVRSAFAGTEDLNSQSASKMLSLSKELALPVNAIRPNLRDAEQEAILRRIEEDKGLSVWAGFKPENAAFTRDNYDLMLQANTSIRENNKYDVEDVGSWESIGVQWGIGQKQQQIPELIEQYNNTTDIDEKARIRQELVNLDDIIAQEQAKVDEMAWYNPVNVIGQLPQIIDSLPYMLGGAGGGALTGSVVPILGTISGAGYGALAGSAVHSYNQEKASFQWEMMKELDDSGNPIPEENIELFSSIYGGLSSAVEVVGLGAIGKAFGVSEIIKGLGEEQAKKFMKDYAKGMIKDKGLQPLLLEVGKKGVASALIEGSEEGIQQFLSNVSESLLKSDVAQEYNRSFAPVSLSEGVGESALLGAGVGFWLGGAGGLVKSAYDYDRQKKAEKFIAAQVNNHKLVEQLKASMPSEVTENYLNAQFKDSMGKNTYVPANALLELYQKDPSITEQLDIDPVYLAEQAEAGLNIPVKLSSAHARLDSEQFASFAQIMKVDEEGFNAIDVSEYEQRIEEDKNRIEEIAYAYEDEQNALDYELDALRAGMTEAIYNSNMPDVENNLYIQAEVNGGVDKVVNDNIELARRQAERLAEESDGQFTASQILAKINFGDAQKEIGLELEKESLLYDSTSDFYDSVIGRLDKQSLQRDYLQTARELEYIYGKKIWARRNKSTGESGLPLDMLADELANRQMLDVVESNPTDALIEKLKEGNNLWTKDNAHKLRRQRNSRKKSNAVQMDLFQGENVTSKTLQEVEYGQEVLKASGKKIKYETDVVKPNFEDGNTLYQTEFSSSIQKKNGSETPRGKISKVDDDTYIIDLFSGANLSTIVHELSHFFFVEMQGMERNGFASDKLKQDMQELRNWLGMQEGENFTIEETIGNTYKEKKALYVDRQERLARGFEQYLREGNAPVSNLNSVFGRFSRWLKSIYKNAIKLNVELTDEVKGVFDRMLATEAEIERSANKHSITQFTSAELADLGIEEKDRAFFNSLPESTKQEAEELLNRARRKARGQLIAKVIKEVNTQIDEIPVYNTINAIKKEGMKKEDVSFLMGEEFANILSRKIPSGIRKNSTGKSPQELAVIYGYESTKDFLNDIYNAENKTALRKRLVQERLDTADTDFNSDDMLFEAKSFAVQETKIAELLSKKVGAKKVLYDKSIKTYAFATISKMPMREAMSVYKFMTSARSNYRKERDAIMRKQWDKALEYNTQARVNLAMAQEARLIEAQFEKMQKKINRFVKQKSAKPDARYFVNRLAYKIGMQKFDVVLAQDKNSQSIVDWAQSVGMEINASLFVEEALTQKQKNNVPTSWRTMPYADVVPYFEEMESVITLERNERQVRIGKERYDLNEYATKIADSIFKNVPKNNISQTEQTDAKKSFIKNFSASLLKADTITRLLDGDMLGIVWESLYKPINGATHDFNFRMEDVQKNLQELFSSYGADELKKMRKDKYIIKAFSENDSLTKEQIICFALNVGNESNLERLKNSYSSIGKEVNDKGELTGRLTDEQIEAVLATLDAKDWAFVQNVWDYFETFQKESFAQEERIQGVQPTKIEAKAFQTKYGEMKGGYFPTVYDTSKSGKSPQGIDISDTSKAQFNLPSVPHGSLKERKGDGLKIPLKLSFDVITNSITQTVHNLAFREPVREVSKLLRQPQIEDAIRKTAGIEQYKALQNWLVDVAGGTPTDFSGINKFANWARTTQSVMSMGYKLSTMLLQTVGSMHAIPELGAKNVGIGITHTLANMGRLGSFIDEVSAKSEIMKYRVQSIDRDVADFNRKITHSGNKYLQFIKQNAFTPMGYVQLVTVDLPVWWGAYQKGLKDHNGNEAKATQYADNIVEITQGSGQMKDLAGVQRGSELQKLFTMYYTFFSAVHQMAYRKITMLKRASRVERMTRTFALANYLVVGIVLQNVLSELMAGRGPEDDEGYAEWIAKSNITFAVGGIPVLRDVANGLLGDYGYSITPASTGLETIVNASRNLFLVGLGEKELDTKKTAINTAKALGFATGSPLFGNQMTNSLREFFDYLDGTDPEFEAWRILMGVKND